MQFIKISDKITRKQVEDPNCPPEILTRVLDKCKNDFISCAAASNENCPPDALARVVDRMEDNGVSRYAVSNPNCPPDALARVVDRMEDDGVSRLAVRNKNCPSYVLVKVLARERDDYVSLGAARNKNCPPEAVIKWMKATGKIKREPQDPFSAIKYEDKIQLIDKPRKLLLQNKTWYALYKNAYKMFGVSDELTTFIANKILETIEEKHGIDLRTTINNFGKREDIQIYLKSKDSLGWMELTSGELEYFKNEIKQILEKHNSFEEKQKEIITHLQNFYISLYYNDIDSYAQYYPIQFKKMDFKKTKGYAPFALNMTMNLKKIIFKTDKFESILFCIKDALYHELQHMMVNIAALELKHYVSRKTEERIFQNKPVEEKERKIWYYATPSEIQAYAANLAYREIMQHIEFLNYLELHEKDGKYLKMACSRYIEERDEIIKISINEFLATDPVQIGRGRGKETYHHYLSGFHNNINKMYDEILLPYVHKILEKIDSNSI